MSDVADLKTLGVEVRPLWDGFGVEVLGADLAKADPAVQDRMVDIFHRHGAMVIRDQTLTPEQQLAFTRRFGEPETNPSTQFTIPGLQEVYIISNKKDADGKPIGNWEAGQGWHTDASYREKPTMCTMLYALEVPPEGSDTLLADLCAAYNALTDEEREAYDDLKIHHSFKALRELQGLPYGEEEDIADVIHPMIRTHPVDGRKALWVSTGTTKGVVGMPNPEGLDLINKLVAFAVQERFVHAHKWRVGDVLVWDNRCTLHTGTKFDIVNHVRHVHRTWVKGDRPV